MNLAAQLEQLDAQQIIRRASDHDLTYLFKHTLTQETAYASLLKKARRDIHLQVARTIETQYAERLDEFAAILAQHYAAAEDDAKTTLYAARAGDASARIFANVEAVAHYSIAIQATRRTLAPVPSTSQGEANVTLRDLYLKRGRALELLGRYQAALASYAEMEALARERDEGALELGSLVARATLYSTHTPLYDGRRAQEFSEQARQRARQIGDRYAEAKILWTQMLYHIYGSGDAEAGLAQGEQSLAILRELTATPQHAHDRGVKEQLAYTLNDLLYAYIQVGRLELGLAVRREARDLWRELDNKPMLADNLAGLALAQLTVGDAPQGVETAQEAFQVAESVENSWSMAQGKTTGGYALVEMGRMSEAIESLQAGDEYAVAAETGGAMLAARCMLATIYLDLGMFERGLEIAQRALDGARRYIPDWHLWPHAVITRLHVARGNFAAAQATADASGLESRERKLYRAFMPGVAAVVLAEAELALAKKDFGRTIEITDAAFEYISGSAPNYLPDLGYVHAKALLGQSQSVQAAHVLADAHIQLKNSRRVAWRVLALSSQVQAALGNAPQAKHLRDQAHEQAKFIVEHLQGEARASFTNLPAVREILNS